MRYIDCNCETRRIKYTRKQRDRVTEREREM